MPIFKNDGLGRMVSGHLIKDAEYKKVGEKNTDMTKLAVAYGHEKNDIIHVTLWRKAALVAADLKKNDSVFVSGTLEKNEYNGKTYWRLIADFVSPQPVPFPQFDSMTGEIVGESESDEEKVPF